MPTFTDPPEYVTRWPDEANNYFTAAHRMSWPTPSDPTPARTGNREQASDADIQPVPAGAGADASSTFRGQPRAHGT